MSDQYRNDPTPKTRCIDLSTIDQKKQHDPVISQDRDKQGVRDNKGLSFQFDPSMNNACCDTTGNTITPSGNYADEYVVMDNHQLCEVSRRANTKLVFGNVMGVPCVVRLLQITSLESMDRKETRNPNPNKEIDTRDPTVTRSSNLHLHSNQISDRRSSSVTTCTTMIGCRTASPSLMCDSVGIEEHEDEQEINKIAASDSVDDSSQSGEFHNRKSRSASRATQVPRPSTPRHPPTQVGITFTGLGKRMSKQSQNNYRTSFLTPFDKLTRDQEFGLRCVLLHWLGEPVAPTGFLCIDEGQGMDRCVDEVKLEDTSAKCSGAENYNTSESMSPAVAGNLENSNELSREKAIHSANDNLEVKDISADVSIYDDEDDYADELDPITRNILFGKVVSSDLEECASNERNENGEIHNKCTFQETHCGSHLSANSSEIVCDNNKNSKISAIGQSRLKGIKGSRHRITAEDLYYSILFSSRVMESTRGRQSKRVRNTSHDCEPSFNQTKVEFQTNSDVKETPNVSAVLKASLEEEDIEATLGQSITMSHGLGSTSGVSPRTYNSGSNNHSFHNDSQQNDISADTNTCTLDKSHTGDRIPCNIPKLHLSRLRSPFSSRLPNDENGIGQTTALSERHLVKALMTSRRLAGDFVDTAVRSARNTDQDEALCMALTGRKLVIPNTPQVLQMCLLSNTQTGQDLRCNSDDNRSVMTSPFLFSLETGCSSTAVFRGGSSVLSCSNSDVTAGKQEYFSSNSVLDSLVDEQRLDNRRHLVHSQLRRKSYSMGFLTARYEDPTDTRKSTVPDFGVLDKSTIKAESRGVNQGETFPKQLSFYKAIPRQEDRRNQLKTTNLMDQSFSDSFCLGHTGRFMDETVIFHPCTPTEDVNDNTTPEGGPRKGDGCFKECEHKLKSSTAKERKTAMLNIQAIQSSINALTRSLQGDSSFTPRFDAHKVEVIGSFIRRYCDRDPLSITCPPWEHCHTGDNQRPKEVKLSDTVSPVISPKGKTGVFHCSQTQLGCSVSSLSTTSTPTPLGNSYGWDSRGGDFTLKSTPNESNRVSGTCNSPRTHILPTLPPLAIDLAMIAPHHKQQPMDRFASQIRQLDNEQEEDPDLISIEHRAAIHLLSHPNDVAGLCLRLLLKDGSNADELTETTDNNNEDMYNAKTPSPEAEEKNNNDIERDEYEIGQEETPSNHHSAPSRPCRLYLSKLHELHHTMVPPVAVHLFDVPVTSFPPPRRPGILIDSAVPYICEKPDVPCGPISDDDMRLSGIPFVTSIDSIVLSGDESLGEEVLYSVGSQGYVKDQNKPLGTTYDDLSKDGREVITTRVIQTQTDDLSNKDSIPHNVSLSKNNTSEELFESHREEKCPIPNKQPQKESPSLTVCAVGIPYIRHGNILDCYNNWILTPHVGSGPLYHQHHYSASLLGLDSAACRGMHVLDSESVGSLSTQYFGVADGNVTHPTIIKAYDTTINNNHNPYSNGNPATILEREMMIRRILFSILTQLDKWHKLGIAHGSLKGTNIFSHLYVMDAVVEFYGLVRSATEEQLRERMALKKELSKEKSVLETDIENMNTSQDNNADPIEALVNKEKSPGRADYQNDDNDNADLLPIQLSTHHPTIRRHLEREQAARNQKKLINNTNKQRCTGGTHKKPSNYYNGRIDAVVSSDNPFSWCSEVLFTDHYFEAVERYVQYMPHIGSEEKTMRFNSGVSLPNTFKNKSKNTSANSLMTDGDMKGVEAGLPSESISDLKPEEIDDNTSLIRESLERRGKIERVAKKGRERYMSNHFPSMQPGGFSDASDDEDRCISHTILPDISPSAYDRAGCYDVSDDEDESDHTLLKHFIVEEYDVIPPPELILTPEELARKAWRAHVRRHGTFGCEPDYNANESKRGNDEKTVNIQELKEEFYLKNISGNYSNMKSSKTPSSTSQCRLSCDIWNIGILAIQLAEGSFPGWLRKQGRPLPSIKSSKGWSFRFSAFVMSCVQLDPTKRLSVEDLLRTLWIAEPLVLNSRVYNRMFSAGNGFVVNRQQHQYELLQATKRLEMEKAKRANKDRNKPHEQRKKAYKNHSPQRRQFSVDGVPVSSTDGIMRNYGEDGLSDAAPSSDIGGFASFMSEGGLKGKLNNANTKHVNAMSVNSETLKTVYNSSYSISQTSQVKDKRIEELVSKYSSLLVSLAGLPAPLSPLSPNNMLPNSINMPPTLLYNKLCVYHGRLLLRIISVIDLLSSSTSTDDLLQHRMGKKGEKAPLFKTSSRGSCLEALRHSKLLYRLMIHWLRARRYQTLLLHLYYILQRLFLFGASSLHSSLDVLGQCWSDLVIFLDRVAPEMFCCASTQQLLPSMAPSSDTMPTENSSVLPKKEAPNTSHGMISNHHIKKVNYLSPFDNTVGFSSSGVLDENCPGKTHLAHNHSCGHNSKNATPELIIPCYLNYNKYFCDRSPIQHSSSFPLCFRGVTSFVRHLLFSSDAHHKNYSFGVSNSRRKQQNCHDIPESISIAVIFLQYIDRKVSAIAKFLSQRLLLCQSRIRVILQELYTTTGCDAQLRRVLLCCQLNTMGSVAPTTSEELYDIIWMMKHAKGIEDNLTSNTDSIFMYVSYAVQDILFRLNDEAVRKSNNEVNDSNSDSSNYSDTTTYTTALIDITDDALLDEAIESVNNTKCTVAEGTSPRSSLYQQYQHSKKAAWIGGNNSSTIPLGCGCSALMTNYLCMSFHGINSNKPHCPSASSVPNSDIGLFEAKEHLEDDEVNERDDMSYIIKLFCQHRPNSTSTVEVLGLPHSNEANTPPFTDKSDMARTSNTLRHKSQQTQHGSLITPLYTTTPLVSLLASSTVHHPYQEVMVRRMNAAVMFLQTALEAEEIGIGRGGISPNSTDLSAFSSAFIGCIMGGRALPTSPFLNPLSQCYQLVQEYCGYGAMSACGGSGAPIEPPLERGDWRYSQSPKEESAASWKRKPYYGHQLLLRAMSKKSDKLISADAIKDEPELTDSLFFIEAPDISVVGADEMSSKRIGGAPTVPMDPPGFYLDSDEEEDYFSESFEHIINFDDDGFRGKQRALEEVQYLSKRWRVVRRAANARQMALRVLFQSPLGYALITGGGLITTVTNSDTSIYDGIQLLVSAVYEDLSDIGVLLTQVSPVHPYPNHPFRRHYAVHQPDTYEVVTGELSRLSVPSCVALLQRLIAVPLQHNVHQFSKVLSTYFEQYYYHMSISYVSLVSTTASSSAVCGLTPRLGCSASFSSSGNDLLNGSGSGLITCPICFTSNVQHRYPSYIVSRLTAIEQRPQHLGGGGGGEAQTARRRNSEATSGHPVGGKTHSSFKWDSISARLRSPSQFGGITTRYRSVAFPSARSVTPVCGNEYKSAATTSRGLWTARHASLTARGNRQQNQASNSNKLTIIPLLSSLQLRPFLLSYLHRVLLQKPVVAVTNNSQKYHQLQQLFLLSDIGQLTSAIINEYQLRTSSKKMPPSKNRGSELYSNSIQSAGTNVGRSLGQKRDQPEIQNIQSQIYRLLISKAGLACDRLSVTTLLINSELSVLSQVIMGIMTIFPPEPLHKGNEVTSYNMASSPKKDTRGIRRTPPSPQFGIDDATNSPTSASVSVIRHPFSSWRELLVKQRALRQLLVYCIGAILMTHELHNTQIEISVEERQLDQQLRTLNGAASNKKGNKGSFKDNIRSSTNSHLSFPSSNLDNKNTTHCSTRTHNSSILNNAPLLTLSQLESLIKLCKDLCYLWISLECSDRRRSVASTGAGGRGEFNVRQQADGCRNEVQRNQSCTNLYERISYANAVSDLHNTPFSVESLFHSAVVYEERDEYCSHNVGRRAAELMFMSDEEKSAYMDAFCNRQPPKVAAIEKSPIELLIQVLINRVVPCAKQLTESLPQFASSMKVKVSTSGKLGGAPPFPSTGSADSRTGSSRIVLGQREDLPGFDQLVTAMSALERDFSLFEVGPYQRQKVAGSPNGASYSGFDSLPSRSSARHQSSATTTDVNFIRGSAALPIVLGPFVQRSNIAYQKLSDMFPYALLLGSHLVPDATIGDRVTNIGGGLNSYGIKSNIINSSSEYESSNAAGLSSQKATCGVDRGGRVALTPIAALLQGTGCSFDTTPDLTSLYYASSDYLNEAMLPDYAGVDRFLADITRRMKDKDVPIYNRTPTGDRATTNSSLSALSAVLSPKVMTSRVPASSTSYLSSQCYLSIEAKELLKGSITVDGGVDGLNGPSFPPKSTFLDSSVGFFCRRSDVSVMCTLSAICVFDKTHFEIQYNLIRQRLIHARAIQRIGRITEKSGVSCVGWQRDHILSGNSKQKEALLQVLIAPSTTSDIPSTELLSSQPRTPLSAQRKSASTNASSSFAKDYTYHLPLRVTLLRLLELCSSFISALSVTSCLAEMKQNFEYRKVSLLSEAKCRIEQRKRRGGMKMPKVIGTSIRLNESHKKWKEHNESAKHRDPAITNSASVPVESEKKNKYLTEFSTNICTLLDRSWGSFQCGGIELVLATVHLILDGRCEYEGRGLRGTDSIESNFGDSDIVTPNSLLLDGMKKVLRGLLMEMPDDGDTKSFNILSSSPKEYRGQFVSEWEYAVEHIRNEVEAAVLGRKKGKIPVSIDSTKYTNGGENSNLLPSPQEGLSNECMLLFARLLQSPKGAPKDPAISLLQKNFAFYSLKTQNNASTGDEGAFSPNKSLLGVLFSLMGLSHPTSTCDANGTASLLEIWFRTGKPTTALSNGCLPKAGDTFASSSHAYNTQVRLVAVASALSFFGACVRAGAMKRAISLLNEVDAFELNLTSVENVTSCEEASNSFDDVAMERDVFSRQLQKGETKAKLNHRFRENKVVDAVVFMLETGTVNLEGMFSLDEFDAFEDCGGTFYVETQLFGEGTSGKAGNSSPIHTSATSFTDKVLSTQTLPDDTNFDNTMSPFVYRRRDIFPLFPSSSQSSTPAPSPAPLHSSRPRYYRHQRWQTTIKTYFFQAVDVLLRWQRDMERNRCPDEVRHSGGVTSLEKSGRDFHSPLCSAAPFTTNNSLLPKDPITQCYPNKRACVILKKMFAIDFLQDEFSFTDSNAKLRELFLAAKSRASSHFNMTGSVFGQDSRRISFFFSVLLPEIRRTTSANVFLRWSLMMSNTQCICLDPAGNAKEEMTTQPYPSSGDSNTIQHREAKETRNIEDLVCEEVPYSQILSDQLVLDKIQTENSDSNDDEDDYISMLNRLEKNDPLGVYTTPYDICNGEYDNDNVAADKSEECVTRHINSISDASREPNFNIFYNIPTEFPPATTNALSMPLYGPSSMVQGTNVLDLWFEEDSTSDEEDNIVHSGDRKLSSDFGMDDGSADEFVTTDEEGEEGSVEEEETTAYGIYAPFAPVMDEKVRKRNCKKVVISPGVNGHDMCNDVDNRDHASYAMQHMQAIWPQTGDIIQRLLTACVSAAESFTFDVSEETPHFNGGYGSEEEGEDTDELLTELVANTMALSQSSTSSNLASSGSAVLLLSWSREILYNIMSTTALEGPLRMPTGLQGNGGAISPVRDQVFNSYRSNIFGDNTCTKEITKEMLLISCPMGDTSSITRKDTESNSISNNSVQSTDKVSFPEECLLSPQLSHQYWEGVASCIGTVSALPQDFNAYLLCKWHTASKLYCY